MEFIASYHRGWEYHMDLKIEIQVRWLNMSFFCAPGDQVLKYLVTWHLNSWLGDTTQKCFSVSWVVSHIWGCTNNKRTYGKKKRRNKKMNDYPSVLQETLALQNLFEIDFVLSLFKIKKFIKICLKAVQGLSLQKT